MSFEINTEVFLLGSSSVPSGDSSERMMLFLFKFFILVKWSCKVVLKLLRLN